MKRYLTIALPIFALANAAYAQFTQVTFVDPNCAIHGVQALPGLKGSIYHEGQNQLSNLGNLGSGGYLDLIRTQAAGFNYVASVLNYNGSDGSPANAFLGADANGSAVFDGAPLQTTVFDMIGFLDVPVTGTYTFTITSDDGSLLYLCGDGTPGTGGIPVLHNDGFRPSETVTALAFFSAPGCYPIEIIYFNQDFNNGSGVANLQFTGTDPSGAPVSLSQTCVAEPSAGLLIVSSGAACLIKRRRSSFR